MGYDPITDQPKLSYTQIFEDIAPYYLAMGMPYNLFWHGPVEAARAYRKADEIRRKRANEELWLSGTYMADALLSTVGNMFSKKKFTYPAEPKPITQSEIEERREREKREKAEKIKARFMAKALTINASMEAKKYD